MHSNEHSAAYDARPWKSAYGPGIATEMGPLPFKSLPDLITSTAKEKGDKTAFHVCLDNGLSASFSFREANHLSDAFAAYLQYELNLQAGSRVAIQMPNCLAYPIAVFGILKAGCVLVNINPLYTEREMQHQLQDAQVDVLVIIDLFTDKFAKIEKNLAIKQVLRVNVADFFGFFTRTLVKTVLKLKRMIPSEASQYDAFVDAIAKGEAQLSAGKRVSWDKLGHDDLAALQYTGGTTGIAKGAELTHGNLLSNIHQICIIAKDFFADPHLTVMTALPLYHIFAFTFNMMSVYSAGGTNVLIPSPRPPSNLRKAFAKFDITIFSGVNVLFNALCHESWFIENPPKHLKLTIAGGTALHPAVGEKWMKMTNSPIIEGYGLTETSPVLCVNPPSGNHKLGSIGIPLADTDVRIVDSEGAEVPLGESGEIIGKGPQVMRGYWNKPEETAKSLQNGWFFTGDIGIMGEDGYVKIVDRKKDMIDVNGFNVFPNEVEAVLDEHPNVIECAVIGLPDPSTGSETVRAYIVHDNPNLTEADIIKYAREKLTAYKCPKSVIFKTELPKTPVGKILRKDLRAEALEKGESK